MDLINQIEALLFFQAGPSTVSDLMKTTESSTPAVRTALDALDERLRGRGLSLIRVEDTVELVTAPSVSEVIQRARENELSGNLGRAAIETLTIVLYRGPVSKPDIDYIRGVNSRAILRSLLIRGLVEKTRGKEPRAGTYVATSDTLKYLGIGSISLLPEYEETRESIELSLNRAQIGNPLAKDGADSVS